MYYGAVYISVFCCVMNITEAAQKNLQEVNSDLQQKKKLKK